MTSNDSNKTIFDIAAFRQQRVEGQARWRETGETWVLAPDDLLAAYSAGERNFDCANLYGANLSRADLSDADLSDADLSRADLSDADLSRADLSDADLSGADLSDADLSGANLSGANLSLADLSGADLSGANLSGADLSDADLSRADLSDADLSRADLSDADLSRADLSGANLSGADLSGADLSLADLRGAEINWNSHNLIAEILSRAASKDLLKQSFALLIRHHNEWCWNVWLSDTARPGFEQAQWDALVNAQRDWALAELARWVKDGDNAPDAVRELASQKASGASSE